MKVIQNTPDELLLESRPWGIGIIITLLTLAIAGSGISLLGKSQSTTGILLLIGGGALCLSAFWAFVRLEELRLSRSEAAVQLRTKTLTGRREQALPLATVKGAVLQSKTSRGKRGKRSAKVMMFRPALLLTDGTERPMREVYISNEGASRAAVTAVNSWLSAPA